MAKKRANGEGSIRKRKDGRWEGRYTAGHDPKTGKAVYKNVLGKTQAEVKEKLKKAISDSQRLDTTRSGTHTVESWVKLWYEVYAEPRLREKTKDYYLNYINNHIIPKLDKLTTIQIQKFYNDLQKNGRVQRYEHIELKDKGLSVRVVRGIHTLLNNCLEQAVAERLILVNSARGCKLPKLEKKEMKVLPEEKIGQYLAEAERRGLLPIYYLELTTGLKTLLEYNREYTAGITQIFAPRSGEIKGACGAYARAFKVLCGEAGIPCFTISTDIHTWNMVYVNGEWLHVDVSINDMPAGNTLLLEQTALSRVDVAPEATAFLKELLVPCSTK